MDTSLLTVLRISAEELANQLTLLDFQVFSAIRADELKSCSWTKKNKQTVAPNIVAFTRRFNHTSFWTVQEILSEEHPRQRADVLSHFIKVCFFVVAVCSALTVVCLIYLQDCQKTLRAQQFTLVICHNFCHAKRQYLSP